MGCVVADDAASGAVFLICDAHGSFGRRVKLVKGRSVWYDGVGTVVEGDVACSELFGASSVELAMASVFPDSKEVVECYGAHVADGGDFFGR
jgi:hypothetical protein